MCSKFYQNQRGIVEDTTKHFGVFFISSQCISTDSLSHCYNYSTDAIYIHPQILHHIATYKYSTQLKLVGVNITKQYLIVSASARVVVLYCQLVCFKGISVHKATAH